MILILPTIIHTALTTNKSIFILKSILINKKTLLHRFSSFVYFHQSPQDKIVKIYKNMHERSSDTEMIQNQNTYAYNFHSHSYDFDETGVHQRKKPSNEVKQIKERYTKLSQPMKEKKSPLILSEICQTTNDDLNELRLKLNLTLTATNEFYEANQVIEDYLFIDIHLGPTIPILLKGKVDSPLTI